ncbi:SDR family NAD(P)-dependent oxidoreductase [Zhengella mangrovi]|uniref:SDR family NAD(P)-dependent oxidoreductase n=1 Tax=Zhengella mangrovi TaxID=1982044 RepID=UPI001FDF8D45|nr:SDR family oxidoreductase [Zhengella mangrovi]
MLITGGGRGIGRRIAEVLAGEGYRLVVSDIDAASAAAVADALPGSGHKAVACDVRDEASVAALFGEAEAEGQIGSIICNAGILLLREGGVRPSIVETTLEEWQRSHDVNLTGAFLTIREFLRRRTATPADGGGRIVTFTSSAAQLGGYRSSSAYISSKSGIIGLTKAAARECAAMGITANAVAPGLIDAPMLRLSLKEGDEAAAAANIPLGRIGTTDDVAGAVSFLLSDKASYITGSVIDVNGGYRMQ